MAFVSWSSLYGTTTATSDVTITGAGVEVEITGNTTVRTLTILAGAKLRLAPGATITLSVWGNVYLEGVGTLLQARPTLGQKHTVTFEGVDEAAFVGTTSPTDHAYRATDRGLWVWHNAAIDIGDARNRTPWTNLAGSASAGATTLTLATTPSSWQIGDRIIVTPTVTPATHPSTFWTAFDERTITAITGTTVTLSSALTYDHPATVSDAAITPAGWTQPTSWTAEVLNVTRDVLIQGTSSGRAHFAVHSTAVQYLKNVQIRYMGPRQQVNATTTNGFEGRYSLHLHHGLYCVGYDQGARHTTDNIAITDSGFRGFVVHNTHGVTLNDCISHDSQGEAFWWDTNNRTDAGTTGGNETHDLTWNRCVSSHVRHPTGTASYRLAGFSLADGNNITVTNCVAVGGVGTVGSAGFIWPEGADSVWTFQNNLAHNHQNDGLFVWQNNDALHKIDDFTAYNCGAFGIDHGAYITSYQYRRALLVGCAAGGVRLHTSSHTSIRQSMLDFGIDGKGFGSHAMVVSHPNVAGAIESELARWVVKNLKTPNPATGDGFGVRMQLGGSKFQIMFARNWVFLDPGFTIEHLMWWNSAYFDGDRVAFRNTVIGGVDQGFFNIRHPDHLIGTAVPAWNGAKRQNLAVDDWDNTDDGTAPRLLEVFGADSASTWPGWTTADVNSGTASVTSGVGRLAFTSTINAGLRITPTSVPDFDPAADVQLSGLMEFPSTAAGFRLNLNVRYADASNRYYLQFIGTNGVELFKVVAGTTTSLGTITLPIAALNGARLRGKVRVREGRIQARAWQDGGVEPTIWPLDSPVDPALTSGLSTVELRRASGAHEVLVEELRIAYFPDSVGEVLLRMIPAPETLALSTAVPSSTVAISRTDVEGIVQVDIEQVPTGLTVSPLTFTLPQVLTLTADSAQLPSGTTTRRVSLTSLTHGLLEIPVTFTKARTLRRLLRFGALTVKLPSQTP